MAQALTKKRLFYTVFQQPRQTTKRKQETEITKNSPRGRCELDLENEKQHITSFPHLTGFQVICSSVQDRVLLPLLCFLLFILAHSLFKLHSLVGYLMQFVLVQFLLEVLILTLMSLIDLA